MQVDERLREKGGRLLAVSTDAPEQSRALRADEELTYTLLCDVRGDVVRACGLGHEDGSPDGETIAVPAQFLLRPDGTTAWSYVSRRITDRVDPAVTLQAVENL